MIPLLKGQEAAFWLQRSQLGQRGAPFMAAAAGVTAVVHPGGSVRDDQSLAVADEAGMAMVLTGARHFRH